MVEDGDGGVAGLGGNRDGVGDVIGSWARCAGAGVFEAVTGTADPAEGTEDAHGGAELGDDRFLDGQVPAAAGSP